MDQLTLDSFNQILQETADSSPRTLDLRAVRFADPCGLLLLQLLLLHRGEQGDPLRVELPQLPHVRRWLTDMGLQTSASVPTPAVYDRSGALQPITRIDDELGIRRVVDGFHDRLSARYPLTESSRRALIAVLIELFQNIPHHSNATGAASRPDGMAAMQDQDGSILVAVADRGVGLAASLGVRHGYENLRDAEALELVFHRGLSRFSDPGRGGELRRIANLVRSWDGAFALRTGTALYRFDPYGGDTCDVPAFPGVQLALSLPDQAFM